MIFNHTEQYISKYYIPYNFLFSFFFKWMRVSLTPLLEDNSERSDWWMWICDPCPLSWLLQWRFKWVVLVVWWMFNCFLWTGHTFILTPISFLISIILKKLHISNWGLLDFEGLASLVGEDITIYPPIVKFFHL